MPQERQHVVSSIDFDDIEFSKENIQPLRRGRNVERLREAVQMLEKTPDEVASAVKKARSEYEAAIKGYEGDDPLQPWLPYIAWTQESFVSGGVRSYLVPLLEKCTRKFLDVDRYKSDKRYFGIWMTYADMCPEPEDIFAFMRSNGIASNFARFYEKWANLMESQRKYEQARTILQAGITASAQPLATLEARLESLEARSVQRIQDAIARGEDPTERESDSPPRRRALGVLSKKGAERSKRNGRALRQGDAVVSRRAALQSARPATSSSSTSSTRVQPPTAVAQNSPFQVFEEEEDSDDESLSRGIPKAATKITQFLPVPHHEQGHWRELDTEESKKKENDLQPSTWNEPLPSLQRQRSLSRQRSNQPVRVRDVLSHAHVREEPPAPSFDVYEDPDESSDGGAIEEKEERYDAEDQGKVTTRRKRETPALTLREVPIRGASKSKKKDSGSKSVSRVVEQLMKNPLRNFRDGKSSSSKSSSSGSSRRGSKNQ